MIYIFGIYITILTAANLGLMVYIIYERYHAFKKEGKKAAESVMEQHLAHIKMDEDAILQDFRNSVQTVIANTELSGQQTLQQLNEYVIKAHTQNQLRFSEFSSKLYGVLVESGNQFTQQMQNYAADSNRRIDEWQSSYIEIMKHEVDQMISNEKQKLSEFTNQEKSRITEYVKDRAMKDTSIIVEEILSNGITIKDQEKLAQQAIEKFFNEG